MSHRPCDDADIVGFIETETTKRTHSLIELGLSRNRGVIVQGASGVGKTTLILEAALHANKNILRVSLDEAVDSKDLIGRFIASAVPGQFIWANGPLIRAMVEGAWLLVEDIDLATLDLLSALRPLLHDSCVTYAITDTGDSVTVHPEFRIIATQQLAVESSTGKVLQRKVKPISGMEHWFLVFVPNPSADEACLIIGAICPALPREYCHRVVSYSIKDPTRMRAMVQWARRVNSRVPGLDPSRSFLSSAQKEAVAMEAIDCFFAWMPVDKILASADLIADVSAVLDVPAGVFESLIANHKPQCIKTNQHFTVGRVSFPLLHNAGTRIPPTFAETKPAMVLLERISGAVDQNEPVLLTGETGVGKTFMVQHLASCLGKTLVVHNVSRQSDCSDFVGGWKPLDISTLCKMFHDRFCNLFQASFDTEKPQNRSFLQKLAGFVAASKYKSVWKSFSTGVATSTGESVQATLDSETINEWKSFAQELERSKERFFASSEEAAKSFSFEEGTLVKAWTKGHWLLIDEVNLAESDVLERIGSIIGKNDSLLVVERGDLESIPRHPEFRLFANMNPPTDVGKKSLPPSLRSRFTEFYVEDAKHPNDVSVVVQAYLNDVVAQPPVAGIVDFFLDCCNNARVRLSEGGQSRAPHFSLRTLARALNYTRRATPLYGFSTALFDGLTLGFASGIDPKYHSLVLEGMSRRVFNGRLPVLKRPAQAPVTMATKVITDAEGNQSETQEQEHYVGFEHLWLPTGPEYDPEPKHFETKKKNFIVTKSVASYLLNVSRAVVANRPVLLEGPTSAGKSSMVAYLADLTGHKCVRINNHDGTDVQEYFGFFVPDESGTLRHVDGILVSAVRNGYWVILDELNLAPTEVLEALNRLLDDNAELFVPETQEVIRAHPSFRIYATQNPHGQYGGRKQLSRALRNRFLEVFVDDIPSEELIEILVQRFALPQSFATKMVAITDELHLRRQGSHIFAGRRGFVTPRDLFRWATRKPQDYTQLAEHGFILLGEKCRKDAERQTVKDVIESVMKIELIPDVIYDVAHWPFVNKFFELIAKSTQANTFQMAAKIVWTKPMIRLFTVVGLAIQHLEPVLLVGETGSSKTTVCQVWAEALERRAVIVNCHQHLESSDLLGAMRPTAANNRAALFAWADGPVVQSLRRGDAFVLDEISLAEDAVLERLNSVLEPERTLTLSEKTGGETVVAVADFRFFATMNPGGDFGKRELSPALRNRFTEIFVVPVTEIADAQLILKSKLIAAAHHLSEPMAIVLHRTSNAASFSKHISIRDIVGWAEFVNTTLVHCQERQQQQLKLEENEATLNNNNNNNNNDNTQDAAVVTSSSSTASFDFASQASYLHGAALVLLDGLAVGGDSSEESSRELKKTLLRYACESISLRSIEKAQSDILDQPFWTICNEVSNPEDVQTPEQKSRYCFSSRVTRRNASKLLRAMMVPKAILLEGPPGVGKTSIVEALGSTFGHPVVRINFSEQTDLGDLLGTYLPSVSETTGEQSFEWCDGILLQAVKAGKWVVLDELNLANQTVLEGLNSLLDHRRSLTVPECDLEIQAHPDLRIFGCQNPVAGGGGRKGLPKSFLNRFSRVSIERLEADDMIWIIHRSFPEIDIELCTKMVEFISKMTEASNLPFMNQNATSAARSKKQQQSSSSSSSAVAKRMFTSGGPWEFNLRDCLRWGFLMRTYDVVECPGWFVDDLFTLRFRAEADREFVHKLFENVFGVAPRRSFVRSIMTNNKFSSSNNNNNNEADDDQILQDESQQQQQVQIYSGDCKISPIASSAYPHEQGSIEAATGSSTSHLLFMLPEQRHGLAATLRALSLKQLVLLVGPPSSGKTAIIHLACKLVGAHVVTFNLTAGCDTADLLGGFVQSSDGKFIWRDSILVEAMEKGHCAILDNANFASGAVLDRLNSVVEPNGVLVLNEQGLVNGKLRIIKPHPNFRLFATIDPRYGEPSRAMRNRACELYLPGINVTDASAVANAGSSSQSQQQLSPSTSILMSNRILASAQANNKQHLEMQESAQLRDILIQGFLHVCKLRQDPHRASMIMKVSAAETRSQQDVALRSNDENDDENFFNGGGVPSSSSSTSLRQALKKTSLKSQMLAAANPDDVTSNGGASLLSLDRVAKMCFNNTKNTNNNKNNNNNNNNADDANQQQQQQEQLTSWPNQEEIQKWLVRILVENHISTQSFLHSLLHQNNNNNNNSNNKHEQQLWIKENIFAPLVVSYFSNNNKTNKNNNNNNNNNKQVPSSSSTAYQDYTAKMLAQSYAVNLNNSNTTASDVFMPTLALIRPLLLPFLSSSSSSSSESSTSSSHLLSLFIMAASQILHSSNEELCRSDVESVVDWIVSVIPTTNNNNNDNTAAIVVNALQVSLHHISSSVPAQGLNTQQMLQRLMESALVAVRLCHHEISDWIPLMNEMKQHMGEAAFDDNDADSDDNASSFIASASGTNRRELVATISFAKALLQNARSLSSSTSSSSDFNFITSRFVRTCIQVLFQDGRFNDHSLNRLGALLSLIRDHNNNANADKTTATPSSSLIQSRINLEVALATTFNISNLFAPSPRPLVLLSPTVPQGRRVIVMMQNLKYFFEVTRLQQSNDGTNSSLVGLDYFISRFLSELMSTIAGLANKANNNNNNNNKQNQLRRLIKYQQLLVHQLGAIPSDVIEPILHFITHFNFQQHQKPQLLQDSSENNNKNNTDRFTVASSLALLTSALGSLITSSSIAGGDQHQHQHQHSSSSHSASGSNLCFSALYDGDLSWIYSSATMVKRINASPLKNFVNTSNKSSKNSNNNNNSVLGKVQILSDLVSLEVDNNNNHNNNKSTKLAQVASQLLQTLSSSNQPNQQQTASATSSLTPQQTLRQQLLSNAVSILLHAVDDQNTTQQQQQQQHQDSFGLRQLLPASPIDPILVKLLNHQSAVESSELWKELQQKSCLVENLFNFNSSNNNNNTNNNNGSSLFELTLRKLVQQSSKNAETTFVAPREAQDEENDQQEETQTHSKNNNQDNQKSLPPPFVEVFRKLYEIANQILDENKLEQLFGTSSLSRRRGRINDDSENDDQQQQQQSHSSKISDSQQQLEVRSVWCALTLQSINEQLLTAYSDFGDITIPFSLFGMIAALAVATADHLSKATDIAVDSTLSASSSSTTSTAIFQHLLLPSPSMPNSLLVGAGSSSPSSTSSAPSFFYSASRYPSKKSYIDAVVLSLKNVAKSPHAWNDKEISSVFAVYRNVFSLIQQGEQQAMEEAAAASTWHYAETMKLVIEDDAEVHQKRLGELFPSFLKHFESEEKKEEEAKLRRELALSGGGEDDALISAASERHNVASSMLLAAETSSFKGILGEQHSRRMYHLMAAHAQVFKELNLVNSQQHQQQPSTTTTTSTTTNRNDTMLDNTFSFSQWFDAALSILPSKEKALFCDTSSQFVPRLANAVMTRLQHQHQQQNNNTSNSSQRQSTTNLYTDPYPSEAIDAMPALAELQTSIDSFLAEFPENVTLLKLNSMVKRVAALPPLHCPLMQFLTGTELLLKECYEWQRIADRTHSIVQHIHAVGKIVLRWRRMELYSWPDAFKLLHQEHQSKLLRHWLKLYDILIQKSATVDDDDDTDNNNNNNNDEDAKTPSSPSLSATCINAVNALMRGLTIGQYSAALEIIRGFANHAAWLGETEIAQILDKMHHFYCQFERTVAAELRTQIEPITTDLDNFIKIAKWEDSTYFAIRANAEKSHLHISRLLAQFEHIINQPAQKVIMAHDGKESEKNIAFSLLPGKEATDATSLLVSKAAVAGGGKRDRDARRKDEAKNRKDKKGNKKDRKKKKNKKGEADSSSTDEDELEQRYQAQIPFYSSRIGNLVEFLDETAVKVVQSSIELAKNGTFALKTRSLKMMFDEFENATPEPILFFGSKREHMISSPLSHSSTNSNTTWMDWLHPLCALNSSSPSNDEIDYLPLLCHDAITKTSIETAASLSVGTGRRPLDGFTAKDTEVHFFRAARELLRVREFQKRPHEDLSDGQVQKAVSLLACLYHSTATSYQGTRKWFRRMNEVSEVLRRLEGFKKMNKNNNNNNNNNSTSSLASQEACSLLSTAETILLGIRRQLEQKQQSGLSTTTSSTSNDNNNENVVDSSSTTIDTVLSFVRECQVRCQSGGWTLPSFDMISLLNHFNQIKQLCQTAANEVDAVLISASTPQQQQQQQQPQQNTIVAATAFRDAFSESASTVQTEIISSLSKILAANDNQQQQQQQVDVKNFLRQCKTLHEFIDNITAKSESKNSDNEDENGYTKQTEELWSLILQHSSILDSFLVALLQQQQQESSSFTSQEDQQQLAAALQTTLSKMQTTSTAVWRIFSGFTDLTFVLARLFNNLFQFGFCKSDQDDDEEGEGEGEGGGADAKDGTGMDDGKGEKDVTDQIENEDQLMNEKDKQDPGEEENGDKDDEDKAADVETDFNAAKETQGDEDEDDDEEESDLDSENDEMGSVDSFTRERKRKRAEKDDEGLDDDDGDDIDEDVPSDGDLSGGDDDDENDNDENADEDQGASKREEELQKQKEKDKKDLELTADAEAMNDEENDEDQDDNENNDDDADQDLEDDKLKEQDDSLNPDQDKTEEQEDKDNSDDIPPPDQQQQNEQGEDENEDGETEGDDEKKEEAFNEGEDETEHVGDEKANDNAGDEQKQQQQEKQQQQDKQQNQSDDAAGVEQQQPEQQMSHDNSGRSWQKKQQQQKQQKSKRQEKQDNKQTSTDDKAPNTKKDDKKGARKAELDRLIDSADINDDDNNGNDDDDKDANNKLEDQDDFELDDDDDGTTTVKLPAARMPSEAQQDEDEEEEEQQQDDDDDDDDEDKDKRERRQKKDKAKKDDEEEEDDVENEDGSKKKKKKTKKQNKNQSKNNNNDDDEEDDDQANKNNGDDDEEDEEDKQRHANEATMLWRRSEACVEGLAQQLCEQLRLILAPTVADKLEGDFKSGKRLNMKKVVQYIASNYRKDRIWMRRSKPNKRSYQIMIAIDDSESMRLNKADEASRNAVALLLKSMSQLEVGEVSVVSFGAEPVCVHDFQDQIDGDRSGPRIFEHLKFNQDKTSAKRLLETSLDWLDTARARAAASSRATRQDHLQALFILSDGHLTENREDIRRLVARAEQNNQMVVFVILDVNNDKNTEVENLDDNDDDADHLTNQDGAAVDLSSMSEAKRLRYLRAQREARLKRTAASKKSIFEMQVVEFVGNKVVKRPYLEMFPFPFYLVVEEIQKLPDILADALRQWFELFAEQSGGAN